MMLVSLCLAVVVSAQADAPIAIASRARPNCLQWAQAANTYIGRGQEAAVGQLRDIAGIKPGSKAALRAALICRILFEPSGKGRLREPRFGSLSLPPMPLSAWPEYPLVQQDGIWFLLDENYRTSDKSESPVAYIDYCVQNGRFRTEKVAEPTREDAASALSSLLSSKRWRAINWSGGDLHSSYTYDRGWTEEILRAQTRILEGN